MYLYKCIHIYTYICIHTHTGCSGRCCSSTPSCRCEFFEFSKVYSEGLLFSFSDLKNELTPEYFFLVFFCCLPGASQVRSSRLECHLRIQRLRFGVRKRWASHVCREIRHGPMGGLNLCHGPGIEWVVTFALHTVTHCNTLQHTATQYLPSGEYVYVHIHI